jgi:Kef-type K+ transport system membrane component KefB
MDRLSASSTTQNGMVRSAGKNLLSMLSAPCSLPVLYKLKTKNIKLKADFKSRFFIFAIQCDILVLISRLIMTNNEPENPEEPRQSSLLLNIGKVIFLIAVLVAAWFILDWLISGK